MTAYAVSITPDKDTPAEKIYVVGEEEKGTHKSDVDALRTMLVAKSIFVKDNKPIHKYFKD